MNLLTANPRSPYLFAYLSLLPSCVLGALGWLGYALVSGPGAIDVGKFVLAAVMVLIWFVYSLAVGAVLITVYSLPMIWLLRRLRIAGPLPIVAVSALPGAALLTYGAGQYRAFSWAVLALGACAGLAFCALAYRPGRPAESNQ